MRNDEVNDDPLSDKEGEKSEASGVPTSDDDEDEIMHEEESK